MTKGKKTTPYRTTVTATDAFGWERSRQVTWIPERTTENCALGFSREIWDENNPPVMARRNQWGSLDWIKNVQAVSGGNHIVYTPIEVSSEAELEPGCYMIEIP